MDVEHGLGLDQPSSFAIGPVFHSVMTKTDQRIPLSSRVGPLESFGSGKILDPGLIYEFARQGGRLVEAVSHTSRSSLRRSWPTSRNASSPRRWGLWFKSATWLQDVRSACPHEVCLDGSAGRWMGEQVLRGLRAFRRPSRGKNHKTGLQSLQLLKQMTRTSSRF